MPGHWGPIGAALAGPALALPITCVLIAVAARLAPGSIRDHIPGGVPDGPARHRRATIRSALGGLDVAVPGARAAFALAALGVGLGIPLALGLMPGTAVALVGALGACTAGHCLLAGGLRTPVASVASGASRDRGAGLAGTPAAWLALVSLCILAPVLRFSTLDLRDVLAAQAATGPGVLGGPLRFSAVDLLSALVGLLAGAAWVEHLPRLGGSPQASEAPLKAPDRNDLDTALRWGESALVAAAVAAQVWGPAAGALLRGPVGVLAVPVAVSTLVTVAAAALVSMLRSTIGGFPRTALLGTLAPAAMITLLAARLA